MEVYLLVQALNAWLRFTTHDFFSIPIFSFIPRNYFIQLGRIPSSLTNFLVMMWPFRFIYGWKDILWLLTFSIDSKTSEKNFRPKDDQVHPWSKHLWGFWDTPSINKSVPQNFSKWHSLLKSVHNYLWSQLRKKSYQIADIIMLLCWTHAK